MVEIDEKQAFLIIQKAKETGSIRIGVNEVTKAVERGQAKAVFAANDVSPAEIVAHLSGICTEMKAVFASLGSKAELGSAVGIKSTTAVAIIDAGSAKKDLEKLTEEKAALVKEAVVEKVKEEAAPVKEEVKEEAAVEEAK
ncbi:MAG: L7Ae/L30e/S12e/Gadd45 family ribosomal protein [Candidatus Woesearchaeota archaeon]|jgi:large subunit ribosomal protein L7Ae|nr:L7Ae/L30e/S12e/Gadd45 family ribosomal protein [Candidatus Woesearchaeota archaeon]